MEYFNLCNFNFSDVRTFQITLVLKSLKCLLFLVYSELFKMHQICCSLVFVLFSNNQEWKILPPRKKWFRVSERLNEPPFKCSSRSQAGRFLHLAPGLLLESSWKKKFSANFKALRTRAHLFSFPFKCWQRILSFLVSKLPKVMESNFRCIFLCPCSRHSMYSFQKPVFGLSFKNPLLSILSGIHFPL